MFTMRMYAHMSVGPRHRGTVNLLFALRSLGTHSLNADVIFGDDERNECYVLYT